MRSLQDFVRRRETLALYRDMIRVASRVQDTYYREYLRDWARSEFRIHAKETDVGEIKALISRGRKQLHELQGTMRAAGALR